MPSANDQPTHHHQEQPTTENQKPTTEKQKPTINMSKIAWKKHRHVQLSFILAGLGGTLVLIAGYIA